MYKGKSASQKERKNREKRDCSFSRKQVLDVSNKQSNHFWFVAVPHLLVAAAIQYPTS